MISLQDLRDIIDQLASVYREAKEEQMQLITKQFKTELFGVLADYIDDSERLQIAYVGMGSPGGIRFRRLVPHSTPRESALTKTRNFLKNIVEKKII